MNLSLTEYMDLVLTELDKLGMESLVNEYQPPVAATSKLINDITTTCWVAWVAPATAAQTIFKAFIDTKNRLFTHS